MPFLDLRRIVAITREDCQLGKTIDVGVGGMRLQWSEISGEAAVVGRTDLLFTKEENLVLDERGTDGLDLLVRQRSREVQPSNLDAKRVPCRVDFHSNDRELLGAGQTGGRRVIR